MEAAAFFAVARFRRVECAQILYGGDSLAGCRGDPRGWNRHAMRERLLPSRRPGLPAAVSLARCGCAPTPGSGCEMVTGAENHP